MKYWAITIMALPLAACGTNSVRPASTSGVAVSRPSAPMAGPAIDKRGLEGVMGKDANALSRMFGQPRLDVVEAYGRKLQFTGKACVLDAYLYPEKNGTEVVTHVDARRVDGAEVDRAACVNALQQR